MLKYHNYNIKGVPPLFINKTNKLKKCLEGMSSKDIHDKLAVSFKQADKIYDYYHTPQKSVSALNLYDGVVYKQLKINTYKEKEFQYLDKYLLILSPLYGLVRYNDLIEPHHIGMNNKIDINMYNYWEKEVNDYLKDEDLIISLTTKEYLKLIKHPKVINIDFGDEVNGKIKRQAVYLKQARGKMLEMMIKQDITTIDQIKDIKFDGYKYVEELSTSNNLVFLRKPVKKYYKL